MRVVQHRGKTVHLYAMAFLSYFLPGLFNMWLASAERQLPCSALPRDTLLPQLEKYFATCTSPHTTASVSLVAAAWAWIESCKQMQGDCRIARTGALVRSRARHLLALLDRVPRDHGDNFIFGERHPVNKFDYIGAAGELKQLLNEFVEKDVLYHNNPWLCGNIVASLHEAYLSISINILHSSMRLKSVCHL